jgi:hypothetical protein
MPAKKKGATAAKTQKKKGQQQAMDVARRNAKEQYLADKTFGLKNKKKKQKRAGIHPQHYNGCQGEGNYEPEEGSG